jgi:hypothetical protein
MGINFASGTEITSAGSAINIPGSVIQFVDNTSTVNFTVGTSAWANTLSTSITTSKAGNKVLIEYLMNARNDYGQGAWCLIYHRLLVNGSQLWHAGHNGSASLHIGFYERTYLYTPPSAGTYTFTGQALAHQGTAWIGAYNSGSTNHYLRLYEIGT